ncbi:MAG: c-type cytochrome [Phycisphaeraceae bacterium]
MKLSDIDLDLRLPKPPMVLVAVLVIGAFVPLGIASSIWFKRNYFDPNPRIHIFQDMDNQAKSKAQSANDVFADGKSMRGYVPGTVAWGRSTNRTDPGMLKDDDLAYRGFEVSAETGEKIVVEDENGNATAKYLTGYPSIVTVDRGFVEHGREQYEIHCYTCHGADARGVGPTIEAMKVLAAYDQGVPSEKATGTLPLIPANLVDPKYAEGTYAGGRIFDVITNGHGTMNALGPMIKPEDRWAIIAYLRAVQLSSAAAAPAPDAAADATDQP